jgi:hypothetical protein
VANLGESKALDGNYMMSLGNPGYGYPDHKTEATFEVCVPQGYGKVAFWWRWYSQSFADCGTEYQHVFRLRVRNAGGVSSEAFIRKTDDLCEPSACQWCGSGFVGLETADVDFGGKQPQPVLRTPWQYSEAPLGSSPEGVIEMSLSLDGHDGLYRTVVLIDDINLLPGCEPSCWGKDLCDADGCGGSCGCGEPCNCTVAGACAKPDGTPC